MRISLIAAIGKKRELGKDNKLPWYIPGELKRFKAITMGHPVIMGRRTFASIGKVLPGRTNIVVTHDPRGFLQNVKKEGHDVEQLIAASSLHEALDIARGKKGSEEIFIIGGAQIFSQALPFAHRLYLTVIDAEFDADVYFPEYDEFTKIIEKQDHTSERYRYSFLTLEKA